MLISYSFTGEDCSNWRQTLISGRYPGLLVME